MPIECLRYQPNLEDTGLPHDVAKNLNIFITTGLNETKDAVAECCAQNITNFANDCHLWCLMPPEFIKEDDTDTLKAMTKCINSKTNYTNGSISSFYRAESGATHVQHSQITAIGLWVLLTVGCIMSGL